MCESQVQWKWNDPAALESFALFDCASNTSWSVNSHDNDLRVAKGLVQLANDPIKIIMLRPADDAYVSFHSFVPFIGPLVALGLWIVVLAWLYARRNVSNYNSALAEHPDVPMFVKVLVPTMLILTLGLFSFSNAAVGASVELRFDMLRIHHYMSFVVFEFSLINTVREMWQAGAYPLSLLVAVWSGFFPYLKLVLMLVCWLVPPHRLHPLHRRRMLLALDMLGKWALIDLFLMNMMTVAFRFHITTRSLPLLRHLLVVDVIVLPQVGLFTFVTAVAISLVSNHIIIAYHRNVVSTSSFVIDDGRQGTAFRQSHLDDSTLAETFLQETLIAAGSDGEEDEENDVKVKLQPTCMFLKFPRGSWFDVGTRELLDGNPSNAKARQVSFAALSVIDHAFASLPSVLVERTPNVLGQHKLRMSIRIFIACFVMLATTLILYSGFEDTFQFVFTGMAGDLIRMVEPTQVKRRASMLSIAKDLGQDNSDKVNSGVLYLQTLYMLFAFVLPLFCLAASTYMLFAKQSLRGWKLNFFVMETLSAWSSLDVFIVSIIASVLEINQFSHFLAEDLCAPLQRYFGVTECFGVETELLRGCWLVLAASVFFYMLTLFTQRISERAIADREEEVAKLLKS